MPDELVSLVVVGCGPAGLAAARIAQAAAPGVRWVALESGGPLPGRQRDDPHDVVAGVGGAGLYSDGKFSFYPAATALWQLPDRERLARAYAWVGALLATAAAPDFPTLPELPESSAANRAEPGPLKSYPSLCLDLPTRRALIERLYEPLREHIWLHTTLRDLERLPDGTLRLFLTRPDGPATLRTRALLFAGGRFSPLSLLRYASGSLPRHFQRWEVGLRLEGDTAHPFFRALRALGPARDPKLILKRPQQSQGPSPALLEWRTFCFCVDGEVIAAHGEGITVLSGRSDCAPTGRSNLGFNVRCLTDTADPQALSRLQQSQPFVHSLHELWEHPAPLDAVYGPPVAAALREGLTRLGTLLPALHQGPPLAARGPTLEGVGDYPVTDSGLLMPGWPIYFAGDAWGKARGLVAALISGAYSGEAAVQSLG